MESDCLRGYALGSLLLTSLTGCAQLSGFNEYEQVDCRSDCGGAVGSDTSVDSSAGDSEPTSDAVDDSARPMEDAPSAEVSLSDSAVALDSGPDATPLTACKGSLEGPALVLVDKRYCIDSTEVTNAHYAKFMAAKGADYSMQPSYCAWNTSWTPSTPWPVSSGAANLPVVGVDWCDADAYCRWSGKRLCGKIGGGANPTAKMADPTASEWYRACSNGATQLFPYGSTYTAGKCRGADVVKTGTTVAVGSMTGCVGGYPGLFDMSGNAYEWEDSCTAYVGPADRCEVRGGSYVADPPFMACAKELLDATTQRANGYKDVGIRCCWSP